MAFQTKNIIAKRCIELLVSNGVIPSSDLVQNVNYSPNIGGQVFDLAIRVSKPLFDTEKEFTFEKSVIKSCIYINQYFNIVYNQDYLFRLLLRNNIEIDLSDIIGDKSLLIEHTSLTPVYPIDLSTYRTTVVGDTLYSILKSCEIDVDNDFFVSDDAHQLELTEKIAYKKILTLDSYINCHRKDIYFGKLFIVSLYLKRNMYSDSLISKLNKLYGGVEITKEDINALINVKRSEKKEKLTKRQISKLVVEGYEKFLNQFDHTQMNYTFYSDISKAHKQYKSENKAYYRYQLKKHDRVISVVSKRQEDLLKSLEEKFEGRVSLRFVNDIEIINDKGEHLENKPSKLQHIIVDRYFDRVLKHYPDVERGTLLKAFKLFILSKRYVDKIIVPEDGNIDLSEFFKILDIGEYINKGEDSTYKVNDLIEKICDYTNVVGKIAETLNVQLAVEYLQAMTNIICNFHFEEDLHTIIVSYYREILRMLGI